MSYLNELPSRTPTEKSAPRVLDSIDAYKVAVEQLRPGVYHHPAWQTALDVYGLRAHWLVAEIDGEPQGALPLVRQSSALFGRRLISLPWVDEAGAIGAPEAVAALLEKATHMAAELGESCSVVTRQPVELSGVAPPNGWRAGGGDKVLMRLRLASDPDELWGRFSPKVRNQVRKAEKEGLVTTCGGAELLPPFFDVYSQNMRDLGSPSHRRAFFEKLVTAIGSRARVYCTRLEGRPVGAGIALSNGRSLDIPWASSLREFNRFCVNHGMYWAMLSDACRGGFEWFHFGRSSIGSGQHRFKKQWGAEEHPLPWWTYSQASEKESGEDNPTAVREKFGLAQRAWTKLPLWASRRLGPMIIRHAP